MVLRRGWLMPLLEHGNLVISAHYKQILNTFNELIHALSALLIDIDLY